MVNTQVTQNEDDKIAIDFLDPLFAVVLHMSFVQMKEEPWFSNFRLTYHYPYYFQISTLFLAYLTIILSWVGYHRSIKKSPIGLESKWGWGRFFADIFLLIAYFVLVVSYNTFRRELLVLVLIFFLFFVWDQFKRRERPETEDSRARRGVTVLWFFVFLVLALFYCLHPPAESRSCEDWIILLAAALGTLLYRWHKEHLDWLGWKRLLLALGFPKSQ